MRAASAARQSAHYVFEHFRPLPCGCVAALYRTQPWDVEVVALEARGPHCVLQAHAVGGVLTLVDPNADRLSRF